MTLPAIFGLWTLLWLNSGGALTINPNGALQSGTLAQDSQAESSPTSSAAKAPPTQTDASSHSSSHPAATATSVPCSAASQTTASPQTGCAPSPGPSQPKKHSRTHKASTATETGPTKTVVRNGGTTDPTVSLSPGVSQQQASHLQDTNQLLNATELNLRELAGRQLSRSQQDTVKQIRNYMDQAKQAASSGDLQRAHNLAHKAELLSAEVAKQ